MKFARVENIEIHPVSPVLHQYQWHCQFQRIYLTPSLLCQSWCSDYWDRLGIDGVMIDFRWSRNCRISPCYMYWQPFTNTNGTVNSNVPIHHVFSILHLHQWHPHCKGTCLNTRGLLQSWHSFIQIASLFPVAEHPHGMSMNRSVPRWCGTFLRHSSSIPDSSSISRQSPILPPSPSQLPSFLWSEQPRW
jgi:hypothetical protein